MNDRIFLYREVFSNHGFPIISSSMTSILSAEEICHYQVPGRPQYVYVQVDITAKGSTVVKTYGPIGKNGKKAWVFISA